MRYQPRKFDKNQSENFLSYYVHTSTLEHTDRQTDRLHKLLHVVSATKC